MKVIAFILISLVHVCSGHLPNITLLNEAQSCKSNDYVQYCQSLKTKVADQHKMIKMLEQMLQMNNELKDKCTNLWQRVQSDNLKLMDDNQSLMSQNVLLMNKV
jgi:trans-2-enoyl-CoA reductase